MPTYRDPSTIVLSDSRTLATVIEAHQRWLLGDRRWDDLDRARLDGASLVRASLVGARLDGASLDGARLDRARLDGASLDRARLDGASLDGASLVRASLDGASLVRARLDGASLDGASLVRARLDGASLVRADLSAIAADVRALASEYTTAEVLGLVRALHLGRVDGSCYDARCGMACLVGTIALVKGVPVYELHQDSGRLAERWALSIRPGDAAPSNPVAALTAKWLTAELVERPDYDKAHPFGATGRDAIGVPGDLDQAEAYALELLAAAQRARTDGAA